MEIKITVDERLITTLEALAYALASGQNDRFMPTDKAYAAVQPAPVAQPIQPLPQPAPQPVMQCQPLPQPVQTPPVMPVQAAPAVIPQQPPAVQPVAAAVPTAAQTYTLEQLAMAGTQVVDAGRRDELVNLLAAFGVKSLTELPQEHYGAFATRLRELGAKI